MTARIQQGEPVRVTVMARDSASAGVTGDTITLAIRKDSDGSWWNGTGFQSSYTTVTMTETDSTNLAGVYHYSLTPPGTDFSCTYYAEAADVTVVNTPFVGALKVGYWVDNLDVASSSLASSVQVSGILKRLGNVLLDKDIMNLQKVISDGFSKVTNLLKVR